MLHFESMADVRSAMDQIDRMIADLLAQRASFALEAEHLAERLAGRPDPRPQEAGTAQAQCAPCSGLR